MKTSTTSEFLKDRKDGNTSAKIETGTWYSGFNKIKDYATLKNIPFIALWSNGDSCTLCTKLEKNLMTETFKSWMKNSGCIFWFGYSGDKNKEDSKTGKEWAKDKTLTIYPFMRFYLSDGVTTINKSESGKWWNGGKSGDAGAINVINHMEDLLKTAGELEKLKTSDRLVIKVNPEWTKEEVEEFRQVIKDNDGYCPCVEEHSKDTKCMCKWFREQSEPGECHCGLYVKCYE